MNKYGWLSLILVGVIVITFLMAAMVESRDIIEVDYTVTVEANTNETMEMIIPIPYLDHKIEERQGIESISINNTDYGTGYHIISNGSFTLHLVGDETRNIWLGDGFSFFDYGYFLQIDTNEDGIIDTYDNDLYMVYLNGTDSVYYSINILMHTEEGRDPHDITTQVNKTLAEGWNKMPMWADDDAISYFPFWPFIPIGCGSMIIEIVLVVLWVRAYFRKPKQEKTD